VVDGQLVATLARERLEAQVDVGDLQTVFSLDFASLGDRVKVYPTENYYYFKLGVAGVTLVGNLRLDAADRDRGVLLYAVTYRGKRAAAGLPSVSPAFAGPRGGGPPPATRESGCRAQSPSAA